MEILFCGGCNPLYHREKVWEMLKGIQASCEGVVILNGCQRGCMRFHEDIFVINVQEYLVNTGDFDEERIFHWIQEKLFSVVK